jgi:putative ABC transport system permease protein
MVSVGVVADIKTPTETINASVPAWAVPMHMRAEFQEVETATRAMIDDWMIAKGDLHFHEMEAIDADSTFFSVFDYPFLKGNPKTALTNPNSIVLTESAAKKYFGNADPMGQQLLLGMDKKPAVVTGVIKDMPDNTRLKGTMVVSMTTFIQPGPNSLDNQWGNYGPFAFVLLKPGVNAKALEAKLPAFLEKMNGSEMHQQKMIPTLYLERLRDVYLRSTRDGSKTGNITNVYIFSIIGAFILLIAGINFVNLTTARSTERAREVGIRKVAGAGRGQLARQFIGESVILCLLSYLLAVGCTLLLLSPFNNLAGKTINPGVFPPASDLLILLGVAVFIGIAAGIYPALVLSGFQPVAVLKGRFATGGKGSILRKSLVVIQFTIATGLIIGTLVVYNQLSYMRSQDLGFDKNQKLIVDTQGDSTKLVLKEEVGRLPGVLSTAMAGSVPGGGDNGAYSKIENAKGDMQIANLDLYFVDFDYIPQLKIKVVAGRPFLRQFMTDTTHAMMLNEAAVKMFGYTSPQQAIGKKFSQWGREGTIVGVVKDFHFRSLQEVIKPLSIRIEPRGCGLLSINVDAGHIPATVAAVEREWKKLVPDKPFTYYFLDEFFDKQYRSEDRFGTLFLYFAGLAIFISCLGLMGLASYSTVQRTKEIGVRKVVGASVGQIVFLLSREFLALVLLAFVVSAPIAWWLIDGWLKGFAYRVPVYWWIFAIAGLLATLIAIATVSFQAIKAALVNPVNSLRSE